MNKQISTGEKFLKSKARLFWGPKVLSFCLKIVPQFGNELAGDDVKKGKLSVYTYKSLTTLVILFQSALKYSLNNVRQR